MDLSKFTNKTKSNSASSGQQQGALKRYLNKAKNWVLPGTSDKRK
jgi:hypothetical protein